MKTFADKLAKPQTMDERVDAMIAYIRKSTAYAEFKAQYDGAAKGGHKEQETLQADTLLESRPVRHALAWRIFADHMEKTLPGMEIKGASSESFGPYYPQVQREHFLKFMGANTEGEQVLERDTHVWREHAYNPRYVEGIRAFCAMVESTAAEGMASGLSR